MPCKPSTAAHVRSDALEIQRLPAVREPVVPLEPDETPTNCWEVEVVVASDGAAVPDSVLHRLLDRDFSLRQVQKQEPDHFHVLAVRDR